jgi:hypothetical protein
MMKSSKKKTKKVSCDCTAAQSHEQAKHVDNSSIQGAPTIVSKGESETDKHDRQNSRPKK